MVLVGRGVGVGVVLVGRGVGVGLVLVGRGVSVGVVVLREEGSSSNYQEPVIQPCLIAFLFSPPQ